MVKNAKFCWKCGASLLPHPDARNLPIPGTVVFDPVTGKQKAIDEEIDAAYLICSSGKCGHHGVDHDFSYPSLCDIIKHKGKEIVRCKRHGCMHTHEMWQGH